MAIGFFQLGDAYGESVYTVRAGKIPVTRTITSMQEMRWHELTRQGWDMSCGAAVLSTLLTYQHDHPFSEMAITISILKNSDPDEVRKKGGFSLFDLKRFVEAVGLEGVGYGDMTLDDLRTFQLPAILPVKIGKFNHFVIFKASIGNHVMLGDPAFGNLLLEKERFLKIWISGIAFYVVSEHDKPAFAGEGSGPVLNPLAPTPDDVVIPDRAYGVRRLSRFMTLPKTRKIIPLAN